MGESDYEQTQTRFRSVIRDRRRYPRIPVRRRGQMLCHDGATVEVTVHDLSPDGLQVRCSREAAARVHPEARSVPSDGPPIPVVVVTTLPLDPHPVPVRLDGRLLYFALINPNLVALGILFSDLTRNARRFLDQFIRLSMEPAEDPPDEPGPP